MSRPLPHVRVAQVATQSESLLPPAIKAVLLGFVGGVIALVALTVLAPSLMQFNEMGSAAKTGSAAKMEVTGRR